MLTLLASTLQLPPASCVQLRAKYGDDWDRISRMSIIEEAYGEKYVRMAYLGVVCAHTVNGVADLHTNIIKNTIFKDFYEVCARQTLASFFIDEGWMVIEQLHADKGLQMMMMNSLTPYCIGISNGV